MNAPRKVMLSIIACSTAIALCACVTSGETAENKTQTKSAKATMVTSAVADLQPTQGNDVKGTVTFTEQDKGVRVVADISGLTPGEHGFHIHDKGDCSAPDGSSAGGHFNPTGKPHGAPNAEDSHVGDMGNIMADASGNAHIDKVFTKPSLHGEDSIIGHAVIVHGGRDDLESQPSGNAGPRVACGVIKAK